MSKHIAVSVRRKCGLESSIYYWFGRAPAFVVVDLSSKEVIAEFNNQYLDEATGAGAGAVATMSKEGVDAVISGRFGQEASKALSQLGIEMWFAPDWITAGEALDRLAAGDLEKMKSKEN